MLPAAVRVAVAALLLAAALAAVASGGAAGAIVPAASENAGSDAVDGAVNAGFGARDASANAGSSARQAPHDAERDAAGATGVTGSAAAASIDCAADPPADHADPDGASGDAIGWVDGYWYDEELGFEAADGLQGEERERFVARTAARVEALRCLDFDHLPSVRLQTREAFVDQTESQYESQSDRVGELLNAEMAAMLLVGADRDWADVQTETLTGGVAAYYQYSSDRITMFGGGSSDRPREWILAHELVHALQYQQFGSDAFTSDVRSTYDAEAGVLEGDATLVQRAYASRCRGGDWAETCVRPATAPTASRSGDPGVFMLFQQVYLYGPAYVDAVRRRGGWEAVNAIYDDLPEHSAFVVAADPDGEETASVELPTVRDRSSGEWQRVSADGRPDHDVVGQAALTTTLLAPALEGNADANVVNLSDLREPETGRYSRFDQPETTGWRGDRLYAYTDGDRLASVWTLSWVDAAQADRFAGAYERLVELRGGEPVEDGERTYRLPESTGFDAAVQLRVDGRNVTIVTAPTVDDLETVHEPETDPGSGSMPGFGLGASLAAVLLAVAAAAALADGRRSRR